LHRTMLARVASLRDDIRGTLVRNHSEQFLQVAEQIRDLEAESFADLVVDLGLAEVDRDLAELRALERALLRIGEGAYGVCQVCERPIDYERLQAAPAAPRCVDCQTLYERTHFQKYGHTL
jgi:DnaK suppressor protein